MSLKKHAIKLILSALMLAFTVTAMIGLAFAWFNYNDGVSGDAGNTNIVYDENNGSSDFVPGDGFGGGKSMDMTSGDYAQFRFSLNNVSGTVDKSYVFSFVGLSVSYPTENDMQKSDYMNAASVNSYERLDAPDSWVKYDGLRDASDKARAEFYRYFVTAMTDAFTIAIVPDDGSTLTEANEAHADKFVSLSSVGSYYGKNASVDYNGRTEAVDVAELNETLATNFALAAAAGESVSYRLLVRYDGEVCPEVTIGDLILDGGVTVPAGTYRMKNSNAYLFQSFVATVVVKETQAGE